MLIEHPPQEHISQYNTDRTTRLRYVLEGAIMMAALIAFMIWAVFFSPFGS